jgi:hypothetical protein
MARGFNSEPDRIERALERTGAGEGPKFVLAGLVKAWEFFHPASERAQREERIRERLATSAPLRLALGPEFES